jgi:hypothetical protein
MLYLNIEGIIHVWLDSPFAMIPAIGLLLITIEPRIKEGVVDSPVWSIVYQIIPAELVDLDGIFPYGTLVWYLSLWTILLFFTGVLFWLRDG